MKTATKYCYHQNKAAHSNRGFDQKLKRTLNNAKYRLIAVFVVVVSLATNVVPSILYLG